MRLRDLLSFAVFGAIIVFAIGYIGSLGIRIRPPEDRINLSMQVADINGLVVDSRVLLRGVSVGKVTNIEGGVEHATIDFYIDGTHGVPVDTIVRLDNLSALGESYIGLLPQTTEGPMLKDGQRVATEAIRQPASISELATSVVRVLNQLGPDELKRIVDEADSALPDPERVLPNLARTSLLLRNTTTDMGGRGQVLLANLQTLLQNASWLGPTLADLVPHIQEFGPTLRSTYRNAGEVVAANNPHNVKLVETLLGRVQRFLDDRAPDIKVIAQALLPKVNGIAGSLMNFDTGQILSNMLAAVPDDGAITLHVTIPEP
jgi:phospholipid/cholesterol/gamma-HCH transport system substrate-binding protein